MSIALVANVVLAASQPSPPPAIPSDPAPVSIDAEPQSEGEIIVRAPTDEGERRSELRRMASEVLNKVPYSQAIGSYSRPMCPKVFGLPEEATLFIEDRMRANAVRAGLNHENGPKDCKHNTSVIFVPASQGGAQTWFDRNSDELDHLASHERISVLNEKGPVRAWTYAPAKTGGPVIVPSAPMGAASDAQRLALATDPKRPFYASRTRRDANPIAGAVVMIELPQAIGKSLVQLADYASMRTFGNSRAISPDTAPAARTILTLFQAEDAPAELTTFDQPMLSTLYETSPTATKSLLFGNVARRVTRMEQAEIAPIDSE